MACKDIILDLASKKLSSDDINCLELNPSASARKYFRCACSTGSLLIAYNKDVDENKAFMAWANFLATKGIKVPKAEFFDNELYYCVQDLGNQTLLDTILAAQKKHEEEKIKHWLKESLQMLAKLQFIQTDKFVHFYPFKLLTERELSWDLNYFKYNFLKIIETSFHEPHLQDDFDYLINLYAAYRISGLQYRDFQSRNIMVFENMVYFLDFQSLRYGDVLYDAVSLLYQSRLNLGEPLIIELKNFYKAEISRYTQIEDEKFEIDWQLQAMLRTLQTLGAYGFLGITKSKSMFTKPLRAAIEKLNQLLNLPLFDNLHEIKRIARQLPENEILQKYMENQKLSIRLQSFSFKKGLPIDETEHGGGFIFDCRAVNNPGREEKLRHKTGLDKEVIDFLENEPEMNDFLSDIYSLLSRHIEKYLNRQFDYMSISFGCTGGQHRSVFAAEKLNAYLLRKYSDKISISLSHRELTL